MRKKIIALTFASFVWLTWCAKTDNKTKDIWTNTDDYISNYCPINADCTEEYKARTINEIYDLIYRFPHEKKK